MSSEKIILRHGDNRTAIVIDSLIAEGGMGSVYRGKIVGLDEYEKPVAVKRIIRSQSKSNTFRALFFQEAKMGASFHSAPGLIQTVAYGEDESGNLYLVMELFDHPNLKNTLIKTIDAGLFFDDASVVKIIHQIAEALAFLHGSKFHKPIIHRDLSPSNVLIDSDYNIRLIDFGVSIAKELNLEPGQSTPGKVLYSAPEVLKGSPANERTDLFSLGVIAFELCNGYHPFQDAGSKNLTELIKEGAGWSNSKSTDEDLQRLVIALMSPSPSDRPRSAHDVVRKCEKLRKKLGESNPNETVPDVGVIATNGKSHSKNARLRTKYIFATFFLAAALAIALSYLLKSRPTTIAPERVESVKFSLKVGPEWFNLDPPKDAERLTDFELNLGSSLNPSACHEACISMLGTRTILLGKHVDADFQKSGLSLRQFLDGASRISDELASGKNASLQSSCQTFPSCKYIFQSNVWFKHVFTRLSQQAQDNNAHSINSIRTVVEEMDAGSSQRNLLKEALEEVARRGSEIQLLSDLYKAKIFSFNSLYGIDFIQIDAPIKNLLLKSCQQLGDEFYAKRIDPLGKDFVPGTNENQSELRALILVNNHFLRVVDYRKNGEFVFSWIDPSLASNSSIFSRGLCYYSRKGASLRQVIHWIPRIPQIEKL